MAVDPQSEGRNTLLVLAQFCPKCSEDVHPTRYETPFGIVNHYVFEDLGGDIAAHEPSVMIIGGIRNPSSVGVCCSGHSCWIACFVTGGNSLRYPVKRC